MEASGQPWHLRATCCSACPLPEAILREYVLKTGWPGRRISAGVSLFYEEIAQTEKLLIGPLSGLPPGVPCWSPGNWVPKG